MRIIAGDHRGRSIVPPKDEQTTRPIVDRVKEALFNRLTSLGMLDLAEPFRALDVFAGTGSLGLEALSRGAAHCVFVERDRDAVHRLEQNLRALGLIDRATVLDTGALQPLWLARLDSQPIRLAFLDPPYAMMKESADREALSTLMDQLLPRLEDGGVAVLRTHENDPPLELIGYDGPMSFRYGTMTLHFYQRPFDRPLAA